MGWSNPTSMLIWYINNPFYWIILGMVWSCDHTFLAMSYNNLHALSLSPYGRLGRFSMLSFCINKCLIHFLGSLLHHAGVSRSPVWCSSWFTDCWSTATYIISKLNYCAMLVNVPGVYAKFEYNSFTFCIGVLVPWLIESTVYLFLKVILCEIFCILCTSCRVHANSTQSSTANLS